MKNFYITSAIPYSNGKPHLGHIYEYVLTDSIARYNRLIGRNTLFCMGMDENAQKNTKKAEELGKTTQELVDWAASEFLSMNKRTNISNDLFIRTTSLAHKEASIEIWNRLVATGNIYKKTYTGKYCVGCESFKTEKDLTEKGECLDHMTVPEVISEENYFFKLSAFKEKLQKILEEDEIKIYPEHRKNELLAFLDQEIQDISFSRPSKLLKQWGIPVPGDESQVIYVWCDALINYITGLGFPNENDIFKNYWENGETVHVIGKDITRFHLLYWPAMLLGAGLPLPKKVLAHGFITVSGKKMSKTIGNVLDPAEVLNIYETFGKETSLLGESFAPEVFRYYFLKNVSPFEDGDFTWERLKELYNADLANGIGNLVNRIMKLSTKYLSIEEKYEQEVFPANYVNSFENFDAKTAFEEVFKLITEADLYMQKEEPFKVIKVDEAKGKEMLEILRKKVYTIGNLLDPFMPETSKLIKSLVLENKMPDKPLFPRYE